MKGALAVLGVMVVGAAAYFIARGKSGTPTPTTGKTPAGNNPVKQVKQQLASSLLTSANMSQLGGLVNSILPSGGAAKVATVPGNGSGFVTEADLQKSVATAPAPAPAPTDNSFVVDIQDDSSEDYSG